MHCIKYSYECQLICHFKCKTHQRQQFKIFLNTYCWQWFGKLFPVFRMTAILDTQLTVVVSYFYITLNTMITSALSANQVTNTIPDIHNGMCNGSTSFVNLRNVCSCGDKSCVAATFFCSQKKPLVCQCCFIVPLFGPI